MDDYVRVAGSTPVPRIDRETKPANGPVITYQLSPEELAKYRAMPKPKADKPSPFVKLTAPKNLNEEGEEMITKEQYLKERLTGKTRSSIYKTYKINPRVLYTALEEWGIKDMEKELELLASMRGAGPDDQIVKLRAEIAMLREQNERHMQGLEIEEKENKQLKAEIERLKEQLAEEVSAGAEALELLNETKKRLNILEGKEDVGLSLNRYQHLASRTADADLEQIAVRVIRDPKLLPILNFAMGAAGEAGEIVDEIKKVVFHGHALEPDKLVKEIGDAMWYLSQLAKICGYTLQSVAERNIEKLSQRYPEGFSEERSQNRTTA